MRRINCIFSTLVAIQTYCKNITILMKKPFLFAIVLCTISCASVKLMPPSQLDVDRVQNKFPNYTLADLNRGKVAYEQKCSSCHGIKNPVSRTESQWREIVPRMVKKANKQQEKINPSEQEDILKYVITMSSVAPTSK